MTTTTAATPAPAPAPDHAAAKRLAAAEYRPRAAQRAPGRPLNAEPGLRSVWWSSSCPHTAPAACSGDAPIRIKPGTSSRIWR